MNQEFHDHLDVCVQCRTHPMSLCANGVRLLYNQAMAPAAALVATEPRNLSAAFESESPAVAVRAQAQEPLDLEELYNVCGITYATYQAIESGGGTKVVCRICAKGNGEPHATDCGVGQFEAALRSLRSDREREAPCVCGEPNCREREAPKS